VALGRIAGRELRGDPTRGRDDFIPSFAHDDPRPDRRRSLTDLQRGQAPVAQTPSMNTEVGTGQP
jgi:hypothetical protein